MLPDSARRGRAEARRGGAARTHACKNGPHPRTARRSTARFCFEQLSPVAPPFPGERGARIREEFPSPRRRLLPAGSAGDPQPRGPAALPQGGARQGHPRTRAPFPLWPVPGMSPSEPSGPRRSLSRQPAAPRVLTVGRGCGGCGVDGRSRVTPKPLPECSVHFPACPLRVHDAYVSAAQSSPHGASLLSKGVRPSPPPRLRRGAPPGAAPHLDSGGGRRLSRSQQEAVGAPSPPSPGARAARSAAARRLDRGGRGCRTGCGRGGAGRGRESGSRGAEQAGTHPGGRRGGGGGAQPREGVRRFPGEHDAGGD